MIPIFLLFFLSFQANSQLNNIHPYPKDYFRLPLTIAPSLAGNFGDLRTNHYHMGLDLRTQQRENLTVVAAADGYVSHIRVEPYGYGRAIYLTHPNGYTTVYGHLNSFFPALEAYTVQQQYATKSWRQDIDFTPEQFPVSKGQMIALSGNTGGSQGPHLHFEIRDSGLANGHNLNPLLFGFPIPDHAAPVLYRLGLFDRDGSTYEEAPRIVSLQKKVQGRESYYTVPGSVIKVPDGKFSFGLSMIDKTDNSFTFGIYKASLTVDGQLRSRLVLDECIYPDSRYINAGIDYFAKYSGGSYMQHLGQLPGDHSPFFDSLAGNGILMLTDDDIHPVEVEVSDVSGNKSILRFSIQRDSHVSFAKRNATPAAKVLAPNEASMFDTAGVQVTLDEKALYDTVWLRYFAANAPAAAVSKLHHIGDYRIPVHSTCVVHIQPLEPLPDSIKSKTVMVMQSGKKSDAQACAWQGDWAEATWRNFGQFYLKYDKVKPTLRPVNVHDKSTFVQDRKLVFDAFDETGDLQSFSGTLDGNWIMFRQKNDRYTYDFDDRCPPGWHTLEVKAVDLAGNETVYQCSFLNAAKQ